MPGYWLISDRNNGRIGHDRTYHLWLQSRNAKGQSEPEPVTER